MLAKLSISNYAIIDYSEIDFAPNFNVITGETGAGKSILLGALSLILGNRANLSNRINTDKKTIIEAIFSISENIKPFFAQNNLDFETESILRRELLPSGKSRAFINDTPVTLTTLKELTAQLIDLHQQHDSLSITEADFQRAALDFFAGTTDMVFAYHKQFLAYQRLQKTVAEKVEAQQKQQEQKNFLLFQYNELEQAQLKAGELATIEKELNILNHAEEIATSIQQIQELIDGEDSSAIQLLRQSASELQKISTLNPQFEELANRLDSVLIELDDINGSVLSLDKSEEIDPEKLDYLTERLDIINRLLNKHSKQDEAELLQLFDEINEQLSLVESLGSEIEEVKIKIKQHETQLDQQAKEISRLREKAVTNFEEKVKELLNQVGMPKANFETAITKTALSAYGQDAIQFLFSANQGSAPLPIKQVASGGELSRLMLALKAVTGQKEQLSTLVFDEIDTGISGEVAKKVGHVLQNLSNKQQVIVITHSPQVAAKGNIHFKVYKKDDETQTTSSVKALTENERIMEIAEMLGGANPSQSSVNAAKELMH